MSLSSSVLNLYSQVIFPSQCYILANYMHVVYVFLDRFFGSENVNSDPYLSIHSM